jgi:NAD-dependent SIR2 family protein deacetylase
MDNMKMGLSEKVAYLKGLAEGLGLDREGKEGRIITAMIDILDDMAGSIEDLGDGLEMVSCQIDDISDELDLLDDDYDDDFDDDDDDEDFEGELYEVTCPNCKNIVYMDEDILDEGEMPCPNCGEILEVDLDGILDDCDCGHDHS